MSPSFQDANAPLSVIRAVDTIAKLAMQGYLYYRQT